MPLILFPIRLYFRNCVLYVGSCFNSYLSFVPFMAHNSFFSLLITFLRAMCLLFSPPLTSIKWILWVVLFSPQFIYMPFVTWLTFFPFCLFPFVINDTHIIGPTSIVYPVFHHFSSQSGLVGLVIQLCICVVWSPSRLFLRFAPPSNFWTHIGGIWVLGVPLGSLSSSFI